MNNEDCCCNKCGFDHKFEQTETGFKLEVSTEDKEKASLLKNVISSFKQLHCPEQ